MALINAKQAAALAKVLLLTSTDHAPEDEPYLEVFGVNEDGRTTESYTYVELVTAESPLGFWVDEDGLLVREFDEFGRPRGCVAADELTNTASTD